MKTSNHWNIHWHPFPPIFSLNFKPEQEGHDEPFLSACPKAGLCLVTAQIHPGSVQTDVLLGASAKVDVEDYLLPVSFPHCTGPEVSN